MQDEAEGSGDDEQPDIKQDSDAAVDTAAIPARERRPPRFAWLASIFRSSFFFWLCTIMAPGCQVRYSLHPHESNLHLFKYHLRHHVIVNFCLCSGQ